MGEKSYIKDHVANAVEYIESNLQNSISWDKLSDDLYLSKYYLHRIFKSITNKGLSEYIRSRKLTESLYDLVNTNMLISSIANKYGFEYESSYTRAFKSEFFISPSDYKDNPSTINITPKADISMLTELENSIIIKPFNCYKPSFILGGLIHKVSYEENDNNFLATKVANEFFHENRGNITNAVNPNIYYGLTHWSNVYKTYSHYFTSVEISDISTIPDNFNYFIVPAASYTVFRFIGFFSPNMITWKHLKSIMDFMYKNFLKDKTFKISEMYQFEYIDKNICKDNYCELDMYLPIL